MTDATTRVAIIGGGPAGLVLAIELGRRGVPCILFEQRPGPPTFPKANSTTSRTMEHYRRLGIVDDIRPLGLPDDYEPDISYFTRYMRHELARLQWPSRAAALKARLQYDPHWPTPEPIHRAQQMLIEPVLKRHAEKYPAIELRSGWRVEHVAESEDGTTLTATELASGRSETIAADFAAGCDGPRSLVRTTLGIKYEGPGAEDGEFMGGRMLAVHLHAPEFYARSGVKRAWQYWALNRERFGVLVSIDGRGQFVFHAQLPRGVAGSLDFARESLALAAGTEFPYEILDIAEWTAGFTLVAQGYGSARMFLAGDAAHLFTPTAGLGYNTSVDDVANLGWKLAAVCQGWGGPALLQSYETERKPIAERNTRFAQSIASFFRSLKLPPELERDDAQGAAQRAELGRRAQELLRREFDAPGIHFGAFYGTSPVIAQENGPPPPDDTAWYEPSARPGARAPHVWLGDGDALYDHFGRDFTLLKLAPDADSAPLEAAARQRGVPLAILSLDRPGLHDLYGADLVLVRPDQHVAWRGNACPADCDGLWARLTGFGQDARRPSH